MLDLYAIFLAEAHKGKPMLHPYTWLKRCFCSVYFFLRLPVAGFTEGKRSWDVSGLLAGEPLKAGPHSLSVLKSVGRRNECGIYMFDESVVSLYKQDSAEQKSCELAVVDFLLWKDATLSAEVSTPIGRVDCISNKRIIEVKQIKHWKHGLGQLLSYSYYFPGRGLELVLFGRDGSPGLVDEIRPVVSSLGVAIIYISVG